MLYLNLLVVGLWYKALCRAFHTGSCCKPMIFVLSSGADPMVAVIRLAQKLSMNDRYITVSLGQGQGPKAGQT